MKNIEIESVKMLEGGTKGLLIKYIETDINQNRAFMEPTQKKKRAPIHKELEDCFSWLKDHLLEICGYSEAVDIQTIKTYTEVTGVSYGEKGFVITGKLSVLDRTKSINLVTPLITSEEDYSEFSACCKIMNGIYTETKAYMGGNKVMTDEQLIIKFNKKDDEFDPESVKHMSAAEKKEMATKILEDLGSIVIHNDEMEEDTEEETPEVAQPLFSEKQKAMPVLNKMQVVSKEETPELDEEVLFDFDALEAAEKHETDLTELAKLPEKPAKAPKAKKEKVTIVETDDDFSLAPLLSKGK